MGGAPLVETGDGAVTAPARPSATMCVVRQVGRGIEVLMVRRSAASRFMPGAWVFPGGTVDAADRAEDLSELISGAEDDALLPWLAAGFRELVEETGIWLTDPPLSLDTGRSEVFETVRRSGSRFAAGGSAYFANWITPSMLPVRFDARFFLVEIAGDVAPVPDGVEIAAAEFIAPERMIAAAAERKREVPFPTRKVLEQLDAISSLATAIAQWRTTEVLSIQPRIRIADDDSLDVVLPGEPGFDMLTDSAPNPALLQRAARVTPDRAGAAGEVLVDKD